MKHTDLIIRCSALLCVTTIAVVAMVNGVDSVLLKLAFALIGLLAGVAVAPIISIFKHKD